MQCPCNTWETVISRKSNIISGFAHCGLYPCGNPCEANEFKLAETFNKDALPNSADITDTEVAVRRVIPSPHKSPNPTHVKPHLAVVTTPENLSDKREKFRGDKKRSKLAQENNENCPERCQKASKRSTNAAESYFCFVCEANFAENLIDFLQCTLCKEWVCEMCFAVNSCALCNMVAY